MGFAQVLVGLMAAYAAVGAAFAIAFVTIGVARVDPVARHAPLGFRLLIAPGAAALWPLLAARWLGAMQS